jgi:hypothetical protein
MKSLVFIRKIQYINKIIIYDSMRFHPAAADADARQTRRFRMKKRFFLPILALLAAAGATGQTTSLTLPTSDNTSGFEVLNGGSTSLLKVNGAGKVGIGQSSPRGQLEVGGTNGILSTGTMGSGDVLAPGAGPRFQWYPKTCAFRVGLAENNYWDDDGGADPKIAAYSIAMGSHVRATKPYAVAIGRMNYATGDNSLALGYYCQATGGNSVAIGYDSWATGAHSMTLGSGTSTDGYEGSVVIGDYSPFTRAYSSTINEMTMRFAGGFRLWTSEIDSSFGVYMRRNHSGWNNYCDRNKKENFEPVDGEWLLGRIRNMPVTSWNYKGVPELRYMGPVAQDFYAAFHLNGTDSLGINTICMDGVNMAGVQALIRRTDGMRAQTDKIAVLERRVAEQAEEIQGLEKVREENAGLAARILELKRLVSDQKASLDGQKKIMEEILNRYRSVESRLNRIETGGAEAVLIGAANAGGAEGR